MKKVNSKKGSVLLSVVCFTTVLTILATTALAMSHIANKTSNKNVRSTQAEITAENYLLQYLKTFPIDTTTGKVDYSKLDGLATANGGLGTTQVVTMTQNGGSAVESHGTCTISVTKNSSGDILVKSVATFAGEEETSVAHFSGQVSNPYESNNAVETFGGVTGGDVGVGYEGDLLLEGSPTDTVKMHNTQASVKGNVFTNSNMRFSYTTTTSISDTTEGTAPTLTVGGYLFLEQAKMTTTVGKRDGLGKIPGSNGFSYTTNGYGNYDGYILCDKKIIFSFQNEIGESGKPIDLYCHGAYFGDVYNPNNPTDVSTIMGITDSVSNSNPCGSINGNLYCTIGNNPSIQDGTLSIKQNSGAKVNGDVYVQGDIYIWDYNKCPLDITGTLYCSGQIHVEHEGQIYNFVIDNTNNVSYISGGVSTKVADAKARIKAAGGFKNSAPTGTRATFPRLDYDPSKYDPVKSPNPIRSSPSVYQNKTPNDMYDDASYNGIKGTTGDINVKTAYQTAWNNPTDATNTWITVNGVEKTLEDFLSEKVQEKIEANTDKNQFNQWNVANDLRNEINNLHIKTFSFKESCRFNLSTISRVHINKTYKNNGGTGDDITFDMDIDVFASDIMNHSNDYTFRVDMPETKDVVVILPQNNNYMNMVVDFTRPRAAGNVYNTTDSGTKIPDNKTFTTVPKNFCYFMLDAGLTAAAYDNGSASNWNFVDCKITDDQNTNLPSAFAATKDKANNIFMLAPDNCNVYMKAQQSSYGIQAVLYGPKAPLKLVGPANTTVLFGQALIKSLDQAQNGTLLKRFLPTPDSLLGYINLGGAASNLEFDYYTNKVV